MLLFVETRIPPSADSESSDEPSGQLTERLLAEGLLTPKLLEELKREWKQEGKKKTEKKTAEPFIPSIENLPPISSQKLTKEERAKLRRTLKKIKTSRSNRNPDL